MLEDLFLKHPLGRQEEKDSIVCFERDVLARRLGDIGISPYGLFKVSSSTLLGVKATLVTYLIVLLQFRDG